MSKDKIYIFDTTLRDGAQTQGVDFSIDDKQKIALALDNLGVDYIEGGWPGANPTDTEFFNKIMYRDMRPATHTNIKGIEVRLEEEVLTITQPFRFDREIIIFSEERELILSEKFREMDHKILLPETLKGDSIHIVITSLDTVVYKIIFHYQ